jgi:AraC-like DNA-binding protein
MLTLNTYCPLKAQNAGLFISRGTAMHPTRVITSHELIFIKHGELDMWEDEQKFHLEVGDVLHLWPGRRHGSSKPMPLGLKFYWVHFEVEMRDEKDHSVLGSDFLPAIKIPQVTHLLQPERMERLFRSFLDDQENGSLHPYAANMLTLLMLTEIVNANEERSAVPDNLNAVATWAHNYIRMNYDRPLTTSKVAQAVGYNADYLGRIYRDIYGCTLTEAIHRRRISIACDFLLDSNLTIEQISQKCGFADPDYFRRVFRRYMHTCPGDYRKEYSRVHVNTDDDTLRKVVR